MFFSDFLRFYLQLFLVDTEKTNFPAVFEARMCKAASFEALFLVGVQVLEIWGGWQGGKPDVSHTEGLQALLPSQAGDVHPSASGASQTDECFCR